MRFVYLLILPVFLFGDYLIKIDAPTKGVILDVYSESITPIDYFEGSVLALSNESGLTQLNDDGIPFIVLDKDPIPGHYFMVEKTSIVDPNSLGLNIRVLYSCTDNWLIKITSADDMLTLNKHIRELKRINFNPLAQRYTLLPVRSLARDTLVQQIVDSVLYDTIIAAVRRFQDFRTRYSSTDSAWACANWLMNKFNAYGYDSVFMDTFSGSYAPSVIAVKYGMVHSPQSYVVGCGHFDCTSGTPLTFAPGADDNASGSAYVMELARAMRDYLFEYTIHLIAFCGEEQGLLGSENYAQQAYLRNDTIIGVVNMDMFAYTTPNRDTLMIINDTSYINNSWLAEMFSACADTYTTLKKKVWTGIRPYSDHASFGLYGYYAVQGRENLNVFNPYYHTTGDSIGGGYNADIMCFEGIKAALATVATLAIPYGQTGSAENDQVEPVNRLRLEIYPTIQAQGIIEIVGYIPLSGILTLNLYDAVGRTVVKYNKAVNKPGRHTITLDNNLNTGVYFVVLETGGMSVQKKFIICK